MHPFITMQKKVRICLSDCSAAGKAQEGKLCFV